MAGILLLIALYLGACMIACGVAIVVLFLYANKEAHWAKDAALIVFAIVVAFLAWLW